MIKTFERPRTSRRYGGANLHICFVGFERRRLVLDSRTRRTVFSCLQTGLSIFRHVHALNDSLDLGSLDKLAVYRNLVLTL